MPGEQDNIEQLKKRLYARHAPSPLKRRSLYERDLPVSAAWEEVPLPEGLEKKRGSFAKKFFLASVLFFVISLSISAYFFFGGGTAVSPQNIRILLQGPTTIPGGDVLELQITVQNTNSVGLESADLIVEFPEGTRSSENVASPLPRMREALGPIAPGEEVNTTVRAILFGEEGSAENIVVTLEYRVPDSSAVFHRDETYSVVLASSPIRLSVKALGEVVSGQDIEFAVTAESNSSSVLKNILLVAEYPFGFTFKSATPSPSFSQSTWQLGDIPVKGKRTIIVRGTMRGEDNEERVARFSAGIADTRDEKVLATAFATHATTVLIKRPFLGIDLALNGSKAAEFVTGSGRPVRVDVTWTNNATTPVTDAIIEVLLSGVALNKQSVTVERGFYRSIDSTIVFDKSRESNLAAIEPGASGTVSFTFTPLSLSELSRYRNQEILLTVNVKGRRLSDANVPEEIQSSIERIVKISSDLLLASRAVYFTGPLTNSGPLPPKAEKETTYTVIWTLSNTTNDVENVEVTATLPPYVRYTGVTSPGALPSGERLEFNPIGGTITWSLDRVQAGVGYGSTPKEVAFQIGLTPSLSQIGSSPILMNEQRVRGFDSFTETALESVRPILSTLLTTDPNFQSTEAQVVK